MPKRPTHTMYTVWAYTMEQTPDTSPVLIAVTPDPEIAAAVQQMVRTGQGPLTGGYWDKIDIDSRQVAVAGMGGFFDREGRPEVKLPLTRGQLIDLVDGKRRLIEELEDKEAQRVEAHTEAAHRG